MTVSHSGNVDYNPDERVEIIKRRGEEGRRTMGRIWDMNGGLGFRADGGQHCYLTKYRGFYFALGS